MALLFSSHTHKAQHLNDGFYEVAAFCNHPCPDSLNVAGKTTLLFNQQFKEDAPRNNNRVVIFTGDFVPLILEKPPVLANTHGLNNKLNITLNAAAAAKLKSFTATRIMKQVAIVMNGEVLTVHKVRTTITGPNFEISRCTDKACEKLQVMMAEKVGK